MLQVGRAVSRKLTEQGAEAVALFGGWSPRSMASQRDPVTIYGMIDQDTALLAKKKGGFAGDISIEAASNLTHAQVLSFHEAT